MSKLTVAKNFVTSKAGRQILKGRKHSPVLLFGVGIVSMVGTVVLASKATLELNEIVTEHEIEIERRREALNLSTVSTYTEKNFDHDVRALKIRFVGDICKLYAPAFGLGVVTVASLTGSHVILTKRNTALMAAYAALDKAFGEYRTKVVDKIGVEEERKLRFDNEDRQVVSDDGSEISTVNTVDIDGTSRSPYAKLWAKHTLIKDNWSPQPEYNLLFLRGQQNWANDMLNARGHVFLNEVYDSLGIDRTKAGAIVGWVKGGKGDGFIDFGIFKNDGIGVEAEFFMGREGAVWLDFNVDGPIYDLI